MLPSISDVNIDTARAHRLFDRAARITEQMATQLARELTICEWNITLFVAEQIAAPGALLGDFTPITARRVRVGSCPLDHAGREQTSLLPSSFIGLSARMNLPDSSRPFLPVATFPAPPLPLPLPRRHLLPSPHRCLPLPRDTDSPSPTARLLFHRAAAFFGGGREKEAAAWEGGRRRRQQSRGGG